MDALRIDLVCPKFYLHGLYDIKGQLIILPVQGNGDFFLDTSMY